MPAMDRKSPATGLPSGHSTAKTIAGARLLRWRASSEASPKATPIANGSRAVNRSVALATPNQRAPQRERSAPNQPRASGSNSAAEVTAAIAIVSGGPRSPGGGGGEEPVGGGGGAADPQAVPDEEAPRPPKPGGEPR